MTKQVSANGSMSSQDVLSQNTLSQDRSVQDSLSQEKHYIFGYGSLINSDSRRITGIAGDSIPVRVTGLQRYWVSFGNYPMRSVGVVEEDTGVCNGVIFSVPATEMALFDQREVGYKRQLLDPACVAMLNNQNLPTNVPIWVYMYQGVLEAEPTQPISQAYLDVILLGCLETDEAFAREFLQHTLLWKNWLNDRDDPRYPRAIKHHHAKSLDVLISEERQELCERYNHK